MAIVYFPLIEIGNKSSILHEKVTGRYAIAEVLNWKFTAILENSLFWVQSSANLCIQLAQWFPNWVGPTVGGSCLDYWWVPEFHSGWNYQITKYLNY